MGQLHRTVRIVVNRYGGKVDRYDENSMVVLFGARIAHEDDPERGVLAAMAIMEGLEAQLAQMAETKSQLGNLNIQTAVHTGEVIVTRIEGVGGAGQPTVMGMHCRPQVSYWILFR